MKVAIVDNEGKVLFAYDSAEIARRAITDAVMGEVVKLAREAIPETKLANLPRKRTWYGKLLPAEVEEVAVARDEVLKEFVRELDVAIDGAIRDLCRETVNL